MDTKDLIKAGRLLDARERLIDEVKSSPADLDKRTFLVQVLAYCGEWDKTERQLEVIAAQDPDRETGVQVYKNLIHGEKERMDVFREEIRPAFLPQSPPYIEMFYEAVNKLKNNKFSEANDLFCQIDSKRPVISGTVNGKRFTGLKDTDTLVSVFLEAFVQERYICIPFDEIKELAIAPPKTFFDLLWIASKIITRDGLVINCYLPVLYHESFLHKDERIRLGRLTEWISLGGDFLKGMGQHIYEIGGEDIPVLEIREIIFNSL